MRYFLKTMVTFQTYKKPAEKITAGVKAEVRIKYAVRLHLDDGSMIRIKPGDREDQVIYFPATDPAGRGLPVCRLQMDCIPNIIE